jgi:hypothetical protein
MLKCPVVYSLVPWTYLFPVPGTDLYTRTFPSPICPLVSLLDIYCTCLLPLASCYQEYIVCSMTHLLNTTTGSLYLLVSYVFSFPVTCCLLCLLVSNIHMFPISHALWTHLFWTPPRLPVHFWTPAVLVFYYYFFKICSLHLQTFS